LVRLVEGLLHLLENLLRWTNDVSDHLEQVATAVTF
jgi:hypothetical protein